MQNQLQNSLSQLKDIKPIVEVHSDSLLIFGGIVFSIFFIIGFFIYKYLTRIQKTKQLSPKALALQRLKTLDFHDTKDVAYRFSIDGSMFCDEKNKEEFEAIVKSLEPYKYKKDVEVLPSILQQRIKDFIKNLKLSRGEKKYVA